MFVCSAAGKVIGFTECVRLNRITSLAQERLPIKLQEFQLNDENSDEPMEDEDLNDKTENLSK